MSIIGNPIMAGASGPAASIFVTGLSQTDTVTATNGSKTLTGKWTQIPNPDYIGLPDGYTQLEYIKSTGTQYINSGVSPNKPLRTVVEASFANNSNNWQMIIGGNTDYSNGANGYQIQRSSNGKLYYNYNGTNYESRATITPDVFYKLEFDAKAGSQRLFVDDALVASSTDANTPNNTYGLTILSCNTNGNANWYAYAKLKYLLQESNGEALRNFIPCKRNSDGAIGLYDLCGSSSPFDGTPFYGNSGTGTFIAGAEVPQTVYSHMISPIRDFGTWTVTATDGTKTATQDVLVDVITEYDIEMSYKLWLYKDGDECEDVTGGWEKVWFSNGSSGTAQKNSDSLYMVGANASNWGNCGFATKNAVSTTNYTKLYARLDSVGDFNSLKVVDGVGNQGTPTSDEVLLEAGSNIVVDASSLIQSLNGKHLAITASYYNRSVTVYEVWLE